MARVGSTTLHILQVDFLKQKLEYVSEGNIQLLRSYLIGGGGGESIKMQMYANEA